MFKFTKFGCSPTFFVEDIEKEVIVPFSDTPLDGAFSRLVWSNEIFDVKYHADNCMGKITVTPLDLKVFTYRDFFTYRDLEHYIHSIMGNIVKTASTHGYRAYFICSHEFLDEQLESKKAKEIEYQPFIVSGKGMIELEPYEGNWRIASGDIHLSWEYDGSEEVSPELIVKVLDKILLPEDEQYSRRTGFYGIAGAYRLKPYGLEYISLTNYWLVYPYFLVTGLEKAEEVINKVLEKRGK